MTSNHRFHRLKYFVTDAWDEWRRSPGVNLLAVATLSSVLFLAGLLMLVLANVESRVTEQRERIRVEVYLRDGTAEAERLRVQRTIEEFDGVSRVDYVSKTEALARYRQWPANMAELIDELESNPLPASLEVFLASGAGADTTAAQIAVDVSGEPSVESVRFDRELWQRIEGMLRLARLGGGGLGLLVLSAVVFVMAAVLRLAVYARRDEIEIMQLVGATPSFIRGPFLVAGLGQGVLSSLIALGIVEGGRRGLLAALGNSHVLLDLVASRPLPWTLCLSVVGLGLVVGLSGSYFAARRPL